MKMNLEDLPAPRRVRASAKWALALPNRPFIVIWVLGSIACVVFWLAAPATWVAEDWKYAHAVKGSALVENVRELQHRTSIANTTTWRNWSTYEVTYRLDVDRGSFESMSDTGTWRPEPGSRVAVEYVPENPAISKVVNTSRSSASAVPIACVCLLMLTFVVVGAGFLVRSGVRSAKALKIGRLAYAKVTALDERAAFLGRKIFATKFEVELEPNESESTFREAGREPETRSFEVVLPESPELRVGVVEPFFYEPGPAGRGVPLRGIAVEVADGAFVGTESMAAKIGLSLAFVATNVAMAWLAFG